MKVLLINGLAMLLSITAFAQAEKYEYRAPEPALPAQTEAVEFAKTLGQAGIKVDKILRSKLEGFFRGIERAAYFKTDSGVIEVIFFPDGGAERIAITETRDGDRYIYSFTGQPQPNPPGDTFDSPRPMYFLTHDNVFVVISGNKELFGKLKAWLDKKQIAHETGTARSFGPRKSQIFGRDPAVPESFLSSFFELCALDRSPLIKNPSDSHFF